MNQSIYRFTLDMQSPVSQATLSARRGDKSRFLSVTLTNGGVPYEIEHGCYAVLNAKRVSDDATLFGDCIIKDNSITYDMTSLVSSAEGRVDCDITLYSPDGEQITSPKFAVVVYAGATTGDEIVDTDEFRSLGEYVSAAEEARSEAEFFAVSAAHGGAISFNGRVGEVIPEYGDYTADMVGADEAGTAGAAVLAHNEGKTAHTKLFAEKAPKEHSHKAADVSDFNQSVKEELINYETARIESGHVQFDNNDRIILNFGFSPKLIVLHYGDHEESTSLYALFGETNAIELVRYWATDEDGDMYYYNRMNDNVNLLWSDNQVTIYNLSRDNGERIRSYIAIG